MLQDLFKIPYLNIPIHSYGLMLVIGFLGAIQLAKYLARRYDLNADDFINAGLLALVTGIAGARLSHVLENIHAYTNPQRSVGANLWDAVNITSGGLTYYGGFLLAFPSLVLFARWKKIPLRLGMDIVAPCLMIGLGFGRIGCFLNGCCQGAACDLPWAVRFPYASIPYREEVDQGQITPPAELVRYDRIGQPAGIVSPDELIHNAGALPPDAAKIAANQHSLWLHPAQLYSSFTAFLIAGFLLTYFTLPHVPGRVFAVMMMVEGICRFLLESLRVEPPVYAPVFGSWSIAMVTGLLLLALGIVLWFVFGAMGQEREPNLAMA